MDVIFNIITKFFQHPELININFISSDIWNSIFAIIFINILIGLFYEVFQLRWPEFYFSISDKDAMYLSVTGRRFFLFRFLPVFLITTILLGVFAKSLNLYQVIFLGFLAMFIYALRTNGLALFRLITKSQKVKIYYNLPFQLIQHISTICFLLFIGIIGGWFSRLSFIINVTPTIPGLVDNIWASALAVLLGTYLRDLYTARSLPSIDDVFNKSLKKINTEVLNTIDNFSTEFNANKNLVLAICIVENIQRPSWFRKLENIKARLGLEGTYGIMQVKTKKFISDKESVQIAIKKYLVNTSQLNSEDLKQIISNYNPDSNYIDQVTRAFSYLGYSR